LTNAYNICIENPEKCPNWLTTGITYLLPKTEDTANPKNYRPITCLPTNYKILTSILSARCYSHLVNYNLLPSEQKKVAEKGATAVRTNFSSTKNDIRMEFWLDKFAKATFKPGKLAKTENIEFNVSTVELFGLTVVFSEQHVFTSRRHL